MIDPSMGSGHILVYAFDVFMQLYEAEGESSRRAAELILQNNLYGLDIDKRAFQLAYFALMMKGREYNRRILNRSIQPNVYDIPDNAGITEDDLVLLPLNFNNVEKGTEDLKQLIRNFKDGNDLGSLIQFEEIDFENLESVYQKNNEQQLTFDGSAIHGMIQVAKLLSRKYQVTITNPPYMGSVGMNKLLGDFVKKQFPDSKSDLFAVFMERAKLLTLNQGYYAMITQHAWMFLSSFEKLRKKINEQTIYSMAHLGTRAFEEIGGEVVQTTAFVMQPTYHKNHLGSYLRLVDFANHKLKETKTLEAIEDGADYLYYTNQDNFLKIPGMPISYWVSENVFQKFAGANLSSIFRSAGRTKTHNNNKYLRNFWEINFTGVDSPKWTPYHNGGDFRKWFGNVDEVLDIRPGAISFYKEKGGYPNEEFIGQRGVTWNLITSATNSFRFKEPGFFYSSGAPTIILLDDSRDSQYFNTFAFLNSKVNGYLLQAINPTLNTTVGDILSLPTVGKEIDLSREVIENIEVEKKEWDSYETSWNFKTHPIFNFDGTFSQCFEKWNMQTMQWLDIIRNNERTINSVFTKEFGLEDIISDELNDTELSVRTASAMKTVTSFISFAVGCMFGRYSFDVEGIAFTGGQWNTSNYQVFQPNKDNILLISDDKYFEESSIDIVSHFVEFVRVTLGEGNLEQNLQFIADSLRRKGTSREVIRGYFVKDFYKDHLQIYKKRPIYWQFESGKNDGFKALIYLHRYSPETLGTMRVDYLHQLQKAYENSIEQLQHQIQQSLSSVDKNLYTKQLQKLRKKYEETVDYDAKLGHLANLQISLDLDDGVIVNYDKLQTDENGKNLKVLSKRT